MKKGHLFILVLVGLVLLSLCGCGKTEDSDVIEISAEDAAKMIALVGDIADMDAQNTGAEEVYSYLDSLEWIESVRYEDDGSISCRTAFGVTAVWGEENDGYISSTTDKKTTEEQLQIVEKLVGDGLDIVILCPYASVDDDFIIDGYMDMANKIAEKATGSVTLLQDDAVSLECLKALDEYDMVFFYSHGWLSSVENSAWALAPSDPYTMTGEFADSAQLYTLLSSDFFYGRTIIDLSTGRIGVGGNFYTYYYEDGALENMFFHFGSCYSMHTSTLSDALISLGAAWVEGWSDSVIFENDFLHMYGMGACLISGYSAEESVALILVDKDVQEYAQEDCAFITAGDGTYQIVVSEEGSIAGMVYSTGTDGVLTALSDATVTVTDSDGNMVETAVTSNLSGYTFILPAGTYTITVEIEGYETVSKNVSLTGGDVLDVDFEMTGKQSTVALEAFVDVVRNCMYKCNYESLSEDEQKSYRGLLYDLDKDGQDELILRYSTSSTLSYSFEVWDVEDGTAICVHKSPFMWGSRSNQKCFVIDSGGSCQIAYFDLSVDSSAYTEFWYIYAVESSSYPLIHEMMEGELWDEDYPEDSGKNWSIDENSVSEAEFEEMLSSVTNGIEIMQDDTETAGMTLSDLLNYLQGNNAYESLIALDLAQYIGTDIASFFSMFENLSEDTYEDGTHMYSNSYIFFDEDYKNNVYCISLRGESLYTICGISFGMDFMTARDILTRNNYTVCEDRDGYLMVQGYDYLISISSFYSNGDSILSGDSVSAVTIYKRD